MYACKGDGLAWTPCNQHLDSGSQGKDPLCYGEHSDLD